jgi:hypothetical protein
MEIVLPVVGLYVVGDLWRQHQRATLDEGLTAASEEPLKEVLPPVSAPMDVKPAVPPEQQTDVPLRPFQSAYGARDEILAQAPIRLPDADHATLRTRRKQLWRPRATDEPLDAPGTYEVGGLFGTPKGIQIRRASQMERVQKPLMRDYRDSGGDLRADAGGVEPGRAWVKENQLPQRNLRAQAYAVHNYRQNELESVGGMGARPTQPMGYGGRARSIGVTTRNKNVWVEQKPLLNARSPFQKVAVLAQPDVRLNKDTTFMGRKGYVRGLGAPRPAVADAGVEDREDRVLPGRQPGVTAFSGTKRYTGMASTTRESMQQRETLGSTSGTGTVQKPLGHWGKRMQPTTIQDQLKGSMVTSGRRPNQQKQQAALSTSLGMGEMRFTRRAVTAIPQGRDVQRPTILPMVRTVTKETGRDEGGPSMNY